ncbi:MAG TPA: sigma-E factor regulatory protein RseB domain-containing protein [Candidatus Avamphibacillus sp.]|nr:sigma-E factor regulatory protein RseB domain-containing protein [Candidatus Avamphibacillus sp.]
MKIKKLIFNLIIAGVTVVTFGCSDESNHYSPEQMISNALDEETNLTYYAESTSTISEDEKEIEVVKMKEWRNEDGKIRVELENENGEEQAITVNDGESIITYQKEINQAFIIDDEEILELNQPSPKEQVDFILGMVKDTHDISTEGEEEEVAGRTTVHLIATPKEDDALLGEQEIWIDKENWMVLKTISTSGNQQTETVYTKIDFDANISDDKFTLDLPEDAEIVDSNELPEPEEVTLKEAKEALEKPFLYFPETDGLELEKVEMDELTGELNRTEVNIDYNKDGLAFLTLTVFESPDMEDDFKLPDEEPVTIRGGEGFYTDMDGFRGLVWQENGLNYSLIIIEPSIELEDLKELTEEMDRVE